MIPAAIKEAQATACLEAAATYKEPLLALATKLAGSKEGGMDLFQDVVLNCHDAVQRNGFAGDKYQFYLRTAIHNHYKRTKRRESRTVPMDFGALLAQQDYDTQEREPGRSPELREWDRTIGQALAGSEQFAPQDALPLAKQIQQEITERFSFTDRVLWRLHIDGMPARDIAAHMQRTDHTGVWRRIDKMKDYLRETFQQAWDALAE
jgi:DNA-directed RNA polymerase specialized sigma24 family protein